jgi:hypothetical protein
MGSGKNYTVSFTDNSGNPLDCSASVSSINRIKSVGTYAQTTRAIDVAVAQATGNGPEGWTCRARSGAAKCSSNLVCTDGEKLIIAACTIGSDTQPGIPWDCGNEKWGVDCGSVSTSRWAYCCK